MASEFQTNVALTYIAEQFNAVLSEESPKVDWFSSESIATFSAHGVFISVVGDDVSRYLAAVNEAIGDSTVLIAELMIAPSVANQIVVSASGAFSSASGERTFSLMTVLGQSDSESSYFVHSEILTITGKTEACEASKEPEISEDPEPVTPPSPPSSPQARVAEEPKSTKPAEPSNWSSIAAARRNQPVEPKKEAPVKKEVAAPKEPEPVRLKEKKDECTVSMRVSTTVTDEEVVKALPAKLQSAVVAVRNKSSDATIRRVWVEFSVANAINLINEAPLSIGGKPVVAEAPRKKN